MASGLNGSKRAPSSRCSVMSVLRNVRLRAVGFERGFTRRLCSGLLTVGDRTMMAAQSHAPRIDQTQHVPRSPQVHVSQHDASRAVAQALRATESLPRRGLRHGVSDACV